MASLIASFAATAVAQPASAANTTPGQLAASGEPPSPADTLAAFRVVESWIREWNSPDPRIAVARVPRTSGACVILRYAGHTVGRGIAFAENLAGPDAGAVSVLAQAVDEALVQTEENLPVPNDALRTEALERLGAELSISLELAGAITPITPMTWAEVDHTLQPGLDGVAVSYNAMREMVGNTPITQRVTPGAFPSFMLIAGSTPARALAGACATALGDGGAAKALDEPKTIRERHGLRMYRFRVSHVAQPAADQPPVFLYRGSRLIPSTVALSSSDLQAMSRSLMLRLCAVGVEAGSASADPIVSLALRALALSRALDTAALSDADRAKVRQTGIECLRAIASARAHGDRTAESAPIASVLELFDPTIRAEWEGQINTPPTVSQAGNGRLVLWLPTLDRMPDVSDDSSLTLTGRAVHLLRMGVPHSQPQQGQAARDAIAAKVRTRFGAVDEGRLVGEMPWLGWAELALFPAPASDVPSALALRRMRDEVWGHQLGLTDAGPDRQDMIGGIVFTQGLKEGEAPPFPTWQCVRPLTFIATMLADPRLTEPRERPREIARLLGAMRYLRQLQVDDASAWMYPTPEAATGGIRASLWTPELPADASSLTLLCVSETLRSLGVLAGDSRTRRRP